MTQEDQDALIGRTLRERNEKRQELVQFKAQADTFGRTFELIGKWLRQLPQAVAFEGDAIETRFQRADVPLFRIDIATVGALTAEIRRLTIEVESLEQKAKDLGIA